MLLFRSNMVINIFSSCVLYVVLMLYCIPQKTLHHSLKNNDWCFIVLSHRDGHFFHSALNFWKIAILVFPLGLWWLLLWVQTTLHLQSLILLKIKSFCFIELFSLIPLNKNENFFWSKQHQVMLLVGA